MKNLSCLVFPLIAAALAPIFSGCGVLIFGGGTGADSATPHRVAVTSDASSGQEISALSVPYFGAAIWLKNLSSSVLAQNVSVTFSSADVGFVGGVFPGTGGTCGQTLSPLASCKVMVFASGSADAMASASLSYSYADQIQTAQIPLKATVVITADKVEKWSLGAPLLQAGLSTSSDIHRYIITIDGGWVPSSFPGTDGKIHFFVPCKPGSGGGWYNCFATWDGASAEGTFIDYNTGTAALDAAVAPGDLLPDSSAAGGQRNGYYVMNELGNVFGIQWQFSGGLRPFKAASTSLTSMSSLSLVPNSQYFFYTEPGADAWNAKVMDWRGVDILRDGGTYYVYQTFANQAFTQHAIGVITSNDFSTFQPPTAPLGNELQWPQVAKHGSHYILIAYDVTMGQWVYIPGRSPTDFNMAQKTSLGLSTKRGAPGDWDYDLFVNAAWFANGNPFLAGAEVVGDYLYIFYLAGAMEYTPATAPEGAPRGIGALRIPLPQ